MDILEKFYKKNLMEIIQDTFFIPDNIATGLSTEVYRKIGSIACYAIGPNKGKL